MLRFAVIILCVIVSSCNQGVELIPPIANAGPDQHVIPGKTIRLDGSASNDPDGGSLSFSWSLTDIPEGSEAKLFDASSMMPVFEADLEGEYTASLTVNDGTADSEPDSVTLTVAASGIPDTDFGFYHNGVFQYDAASGSDYGYQLCLQDTGKILFTGSFYTGSSHDIIAMRLTSEGKRDSEFSDRGVFTYDVGFDDAGTDIVTQDNGKILIGGYGFRTGTEQDILVMRLSGDGQLDNTFGSSGVFLHDVDNGEDLCRDIFLQSDGKILATGRTFNGVDIDMFLLRLNADGTLDTGFATDGIAVYDGGAGDGHDEGLSVFTLDNGDVFVGGYVDNGSDDDIALWRFTSGGEPDSSFGTNGVVLFDTGSYEKLQQAILLENGKIAVAGSAMGATDEDLLLARFNEDGTPDTSFGENGMTVYAGNYQHDDGRDVTVDSLGRLIVTGTISNSANRDIALLRFHENGTLDTSFGTEGVCAFDGGYYDDYGRAVSVRPDGRILVAGNSSNGSNMDAVVLQYR